SSPTARSGPSESASTCRSWSPWRPGTAARRSTRGASERMKRAAVLLAACVLVLPGCGSRPRAPAILDEPVYQNDRQGFRFLAPQGWTQHPRAELPPGKLDKERLLVAYRQRGNEAPAALEVAAVDFPEPSALTAYLAAASHSAKEWRLVGKPET